MEIYEYVFKDGFKLHDVQALKWLEKKRYIKAHGPIVARVVTAWEVI